MKPKYQRILLKLSGEAMAGTGQFGLDSDAINRLGHEIKEVHELGVQIAVVMGGGNIFRGTQVSWMDRATADYSGMLATLINSLALQDVLEKISVFTRVLSAIDMQQVAEPYIRRRAMRHMEKGRVAIFAAGTGNPFFSTDTAAALRAMETHCEVILKGTKVDGVYSADPFEDKQAKRFQKLSYIDVLKKNLKVMDSTAISLCMDHKLPVVVFDLFKKGNLKRVVCGENIGTTVS